MKFNHPFQLKQERNTTDILPAILPSFEKRQTSKDASKKILALRFTLLFLQS